MRIWVISIQSIFSSGLPDETESCELGQAGLAEVMPDSSRTTPRPAGRFTRWSYQLRKNVGILLGVLLLAICARTVDWTSLISSFATTRLDYLALVFLSVWLTILAKAVRWRSLYRTGHVVPYSHFLAGIVLGQITNALLPGRAGDVARVAMLGREKETGYALTVGTLIAEKVLDGLILLTLVVALLPLAPGVSWLNGFATVGAIGLSTGFLLLCLVLLRQESARAVLGGLIGRVVGRYRPNWSRQLVTGLAQMSDVIPIRWSPWAWSVLIWVLAAATNQLMFLALNLHLAWIAAPFLLVVLHLGRLVGVTPGQIGIFHYLTILALGAYGVERNTAFVGGVLLHLAVVGLPILLGPWALRREGAYWSELLQPVSQMVAHRADRPGTDAQEVRDDCPTD